jgi:hypothetical protein
MLLRNVICIFELEQLDLFELGWQSGWARGGSYVFNHIANYTCYLILGILVGKYSIWEIFL